MEHETMERPDGSGGHGAAAVRRNLAIFWEGAVLSYIALFRWLRPSTYLASKVLMPLAQMLFFTLVGTFGSSNLGPEFFVIGNAIQIAAVNGIYGVTMSIGGDRWNGTLPYLFGTPANRLVLFAGRSFIHILDGFVGVVTAFLWGSLLFGVTLPLSGVPALALTILTATFATSGLGLLMGCVGLITRNVMFVNNTIYFLLLLFSGANVPLDSLPGWIRAVGGVLPLTNGIAAARRIAEGAGLSEVGPYLLREALIGVLYYAAGYLLFRSFETAAKRRGSLETV